MIPPPTPIATILQATNVYIALQPPCGKELPRVIIPDNEENFIPELKLQTVFSKNSVILCPSIFKQR